MREAVIEMLDGAVYDAVFTQEDMSPGAFILAALTASGFAVVSVELIERLCSELEAEVQERWGFDERLSRQLNRDMATVVEVRAMLAAANKEPNDDE